MAKDKYTRSFRMQVAKEALRPENEGLERVIALKYDILPATVRRWRAAYIAEGENAFQKGFSRKEKRTPREIELEKKVEDLEEEVKILKKAAAFLANARHE